MLINSFVKSDFGLRPVKVEVVLVPGISQIQILGLADQIIKESSRRIQSALRCQGFCIPPGKQVLVNLQPNYVKKTSQGLDLAIAIGILVESSQVLPDFFNFKDDYIYGSLSLKGDIQVPEDLKLLNFEKFGKRLFTGYSSEVWRFDTLTAPSLGGLMNLQYKEGCHQSEIIMEELLTSEFCFESRLARLMTIVAHGEHPMLIAGYSGCGKTTLAENVAKVLNPCDEKTFLQAKKYWMLSGRKLSGRPVVQPHHSITPIAMIGGGVPIKFGEISLAHGGVLILDELLEFHRQVQSALREPMEKGIIYLSRGGVRQTFPAQSLVLATTNLCPCGNFRPGTTYQCRCSSLKLRTYIERLTGPFLDRFALVHIYEDPKIKLGVTLSTIKEQVVEAMDFQKTQRKQLKLNQHLSLVEVMEGVEASVSSDLIPFSKSHRRRLSLLRVARTIADLDTSLKIKSHHLEEAQQWTANDIYKLERFRLDDFAMR